MLSHSQLETANVESLLGAGFRPQAQPLQQIDLSFIDQTFNNYAIHHPDTSPSQWSFWMPSIWPKQSELGKLGTSLTTIVINLINHFSSIPLYSTALPDLSFYND